MVWIWITMIIVIVGAEINSEAEHQTARDSTTGPDRTMGARGAVMADRVGPSYGSSKSQRGQRPGRAEAAREDAQLPRRSEGLSLGKIALALPVVLAMSWIEQRRRRKANL